MKKRWLIVVGFLVCFCTNSAFAQTDWSKVEIKVHKVNGNVYTLEGAGGNIGYTRFVKPRGRFLTVNIESGELSRVPSWANRDTSTGPRIVMITLCPHHAKTCYRR